MGYTVGKKEDGNSMISYFICTEAQAANNLDSKIGDVCKDASEYRFVFKFSNTCISAKRILQCMGIFTRV